MRFAAGQEWSYRAPAGYENSRIVIGAVATCSSGPIICFSVLNAPRAGENGATELVTIPFVPMQEAAFARSVDELQGQADPPPEFSAALTSWSADERGLTVFTVPFEGGLDRMIALQMAAIVGEPAA